MQETKENENEWLDKAFLQNILQCYKRDPSIQVLSFVVKDESSNAFLSELTQVRIEFATAIKSEPEHLDVVIKTKPQGEGFNAKVVSDGPLFENEMRMYRQTIPVIYQLFKRNGMEIDIAPEIIYASQEPFPIIVLKDMSADGYLSPSQPPDTLADSKKIVRKLAKFHAASFYLAETGEHDFTNFNHSLFRTDEIVKGFFDKTLQVFREVIGSWPDYEYLVSRLETFSRNISENGRKLYTASESGDGFNVLNHGDFHEGNILIKVDEEQRLEDLRFIDFQLSIYCSPAIDLIFMFDLLKRDENGELPIEEILLFYHEQFADTLRKFGFNKPTPSLDSFKAELSRNGQLQVLRQIVIIPFAFADQIEKPEEIEDDAYRKLLYNNPPCKMIFQKLLKSWVEKGWL